MTTPWIDKPMSDRSFRVALSGIVHDDDPTIIADMQQRIELLEKEAETLRRLLREAYTRLGQVSEIV